MLNKTSGISNEVKFSAEEIRLMSGNVLTHNHTNGTTFTAPDIYFLKKAHLSEFRASNRNGAYVIRQPLLWNENLDTIDAIDDILYDYEMEYAQKKLYQVN